MHHIFAHLVKQHIQSYEHVAYIMHACPRMYKIRSHVGSRYLVGVSTCRVLSVQQPLAEPLISVCSCSEMGKKRLPQPKPGAQSFVSLFCKPVSPTVANSEPSPPNGAEGSSSQDALPPETALPPEVAVSPSAADASVPPLGAPSRPASEASPPPSPVATRDASSSQEALPPETALSASEHRCPTPPRPRRRRRVTLSLRTRRHQMLWSRR